MYNVNKKIKRTDDGTIHSHLYSTNEGTSTSAYRFSLFTVPLDDFQDREHLGGSRPFFFFCGGFGKKNHN